MDFMNSSTFIFMVLGLWSIGAVPAFINYNLAGKPLTHSIRTSNARLLVVDEELRHCFPAEQEKILTSSGFRDGKGPVEIVFHTSEVEAQILGMEPTREDDSVRGGLVPRDMAILIYTSGTTGLPKPAIVSWKKCWSGSLFIGHWLNITPSDRFFTVRLRDLASGFLKLIFC
jgi:acyl-CoA synthetase (AMP-forming)/AMP-acid ligase II